ncbi:hypothetical protein [Actinokineospora sp. NBRC 105648]|uniref:hypothetical protein n=1 Tax=Actinokineospora sp. NBRC 105648 TaxID=3032206 RepID=UPI0025525C3B|nr:hypothetical protein [Actinokineospora sp. NBRC 105648]
MLTEAAEALSGWRTVSLVSALREALHGRTSWPPALVRNAGSLQAIVDELTVRGLDGDSIVRFGLGPELISNVVTTFLPRWLPSVRVEGSPFDAASATTPDDHAGGWQRILWSDIERATAAVGAGRPGLDHVTAVVGAIVTKVLPWTRTAPLADLLALRPPAVAPEPDVDLALERDVVPQYRWIVERLSVTRLTDWSTTSLHLEHRWMAGIDPPPCAEVIMADRLVVAAELNAEIARRATTVSAGASYETPVGLDGALASNMMRHAVGLLVDGRAREAAALYEFAVSQNPEDASAANNFGFCLMAFNPRAALEQLRRAEVLGYQPRCVNIYNRALCLALLDDHRAALGVLDDHWAGMGGGKAILWQLDGGRLVLAADADCCHVAALLAFQISGLVSDRESALRWLSRATRVSVRKQLGPGRSDS